MLHSIILESHFPGATPPVLQTPPSTPGGTGHRMPTPVPPHPQPTNSAPGPGHHQIPHGPHFSMGMGGPIPSHMIPPGHLERESGPPGMMPHGHPHGPPMNPHLPPHMHPHHRGPPMMLQPEFRIYELNKRLQQRNDECDSIWWDSFASEFFEDDAQLTLSFMMDDGPKRYSIGRTLIPRYFRSIFESGCNELYYQLRATRDYPSGMFITVDSDQANMVMSLTRPLPCTVVVEGRLVLDFTLDELMRIKAWNFQIRTHREMVLRSMLAMQEPNLLEQLSKNLTRNGVTNNTLNFFRLCVILEPMQELMSRQKAYSLTPRDCLKTTLFQKWQRMVAPPTQSQKPESNRSQKNRRKRKASNANSDGASTKSNSKRKQSPGASVTPNNGAGPQPGDVMIVGEPTLMGGEFGDEDERLITRLENTQFDANANNTAILPPPMPGNNGPPSSQAGNISGPVDPSQPINNGNGGRSKSNKTPNGRASASPQNAGNNGPRSNSSGSVSGKLGNIASGDQGNPGSAPPSVSRPASNSGTPGPPMNSHSASGTPIPNTGPPMSSMSSMMPSMPMLHPAHGGPPPYMR